MISRQKDFYAAFIITAFCAAVGCYLILARPDRTETAGFLFTDAGFNLLVTEHLLKGERLYRDIHCFYGPLPSYAFAAFSKFFGNTMQSYNFFHLAFCLPAIAAAYFLLRRYVSVSSAVAAVLLGFTPVFLTPGSPLGGAMHSSYIPFERFLLLWLALLWKPPAERSSSRAMTMGLVLGLWHGIKFGGAIFAGAAIFLLDLFILIGERDRKMICPWLSRFFLMGIIFLGVEAVWAILAFAFLPPAVARDAFWPSFHIEICKATIGHGFGSRWLEITDMKMFFGQYLIPFSAVLFSIAGLFYGDVRKRPGLYFFLLFYVLGSFIYFQHIFTFRHYMWMLVLPAAYLLDRLKPFFRFTALFLWLPGFLLMMKIIFLNPVDSQLEILRMPTGEKMWADRETASAVSGIRELLEKNVTLTKPEDFILIMRLGAGFHHFYGVPHLPRNVWFTKGHVRPYDEDRLAHSLQHVKAVVVEEQNKNPEGFQAPDPCSLITVAPFRPDLCRELAGRMAPGVRLPGGFWFFSEKSARGGEE